MNSKELRKWLEARGVVVVNTKTLRDGRVRAYSCFYYGPKKAHWFEVSPYFPNVICGYYTNDEGLDYSTKLWNENDVEMIERTPERD